MKKYFKKSLSLFMAALMLMSCWVFFAPEAKAVNSGEYWYRVYAKTDNGEGGADGKGFDWTLYGKGNNGTAGEKQMGTKSQLLKDDDKEYTLFQGTSSSFPTKFTGKYWNKAVVNRTLSAYVYMLVGTSESDAQQVSLTATASDSGGSGWSKASGNHIEFKSKKKTVNFTITVNSGSYPKASTVVMTKPDNVTIPKTGTTTTSFTSYVKDQYGVVIGSSSTGYSKSVSLSSNRSSTTGFKAAYGTTTDSNDPCTITVDNSAKLQKFDDNTITAKASYTFNRATVSKEQSFVATDPTYTFSFNGNGGSISPNASVKKYYYNTLASSEIPSTGDRAGYDFLGMYGDDKDDSYAGAKPTYPGALSTSTYVEGNKTWYAAWWAKNYTVTFVDLEGNVLGTTTVKYGKTLAESINLGVASLPSNVPAYPKTPGQEGTYKYTYEAVPASWTVIESKAETGYGARPAASYGDDGATAIITGDTTFRVKYTLEQKAYELNFNNFAGNNISKKSDYRFRDLIIYPDNQTMKADNYFTYTFKGWHKVRKDERTNGYIVNGDGFVAENKTDATATGGYVIIDSENDAKVRENATYVPVFEKTYIDYKVNFVYYNETGTQETTEAKKYHYNEALETPDVPAFYDFDGFRYHLNESGWTKGKGGEAVGAMPKVATENATYYATYGAGIPSVYEVTFTYIDTDGTEKTEKQDVTHGQNTVKPSDPQKYRDESNEYTFSKWVDQNGNDFVASPRQNLRYTAQYTASPLYTVTFMNEGEQVGEVRKYVKGEAITLPADPTKEPDVYASKYTFAGWKDSKGDVPSVMGEENLVFEAQYTPDYIDYEITFAWMNADGTKETDTKKYHYGYEIVIPANPKGYQDNTYKYEFKAWDNDVAKHCTGNVTYTATYRRSYVFYGATFYKEAYGTADNEIHFKDSFIYNEKLRIPTVPPKTSKTTGNPNKEYVFDHWQYLDNGELKDFVNGMSITAAMKFYPFYKEVTATRTVTLLNDDGSELAKVTVEYGDTLSKAGISNPKKMYDETQHFNFAGWRKGDVAYDADAAITEDITLRASYTSAGHIFGEIVADKLPTFTETGLGSRYCECGKEKPNVEIEKIPDTKAPTAKIYVKDKTVKTGEDASLDMTKPVYVAPSTNIIVATADTAQYSKYNPGLKGIGTKKIEYFVSDSHIDAETITAWKTRFDYDAYVEYLKKENEESGLPAELTKEQELMLKELEVNASTTIGALADEHNIADGAEFVCYVKITDKNGNISYLHSNLLKYDKTAPVITLKDAQKDQFKFCKEFTATIKGNEEKTDLDSVTVNGTAVEIPEDGVVTVSKNEAGTYRIIATDIAGNSTVANITIVGEHKEKRYVTEATCEGKGHIVVRCTVCGEVISSTDIDPLGHDWKKVETVKPTCTEDGYTVYRCANCGKIKKDINEGSSTGEHKYGEYNVSRAATCVEEGTKVRTCSVCGAKDYQTIEKDLEAHNWRHAIVTRPTCTEDGYSTRTCKLCGTIDTFAPTEKLGHTASDKWVVTVEPTCTEPGTKVQYCVRCGDSYGAMNTETIPATGHSFRWEKTVAPTTDEEGYTLYVCMVCGAEERTAIVEKLAKTTITFYDEDGKTVIKKFEDAVEGNRFTAKDVVEPTKAETKKYKYTFSHWENVEANEEGKHEKVNLPIVAGKKDISVKAVFKEIEKKFTITLFEEDGTTQFNRVGYLVYGQKYTIESAAGEPQKAADDMYTYEFAGWIKKDEVDKTKASKVITVEGEGEYKAVFTETAKKYNVIFAYDYENVISQEKVDAGTLLARPAKPTKKYDDEKHYDFQEWFVKDGIDFGDPIKSDILVLAKFNAVYHTAIKTDVVKDATCTETGISKEECSCGHVSTVVTPVHGHEWSAYDETGTRKCARCGATESRDDTYTVSFMVEGAEKAFKVFSGIKYNGTISSVPTAEKKDTVYKTYTFVKWYKQGDETKTAVSVDEIEAAKVTANVVYVAVFEEADRYYNVFYAIDAQHVLKTYKVKAGSSLPVYDGETPTLPDSFDSTTHRVFDDWAKNDDNYPEGVIEDSYILAKFKDESHTFSKVSSSMKNATCTEPKKETYKCEKCNATYEKTEGKALGHDWELIETVEPTDEKVGYRLYKCKRANCGETKKEEIAVKSLVDLVVTVTDQNGKPISGAKVSVFDGTTLVGTKTTGSDGIAIFRVEAGKKYRIVVEYNGNHLENDVTVNPDGSTSGGGNFNINIPHCSCTCHRNGVWPAIFRFFHKIIKMLVGHFVCCGDPDSRYGS